MQRAQDDQLRKKDCRVQQLFETVTNLKVIKLHVWESTFESIVSDLRRDELSSVRRFITFQAVQGFVWNCAVFLVAFVCLSFYSTSVGSTLGNGLDAQTAFVTLALLNTMRSAFRLIPSCVTAFSQSSVSIKRVDDFLNSSDNLVSPSPNDKVAPRSQASSLAVTPVSDAAKSPQPTSPKKETWLKPPIVANSSHPEVPPNVALYLKNCHFSVKNSRSSGGGRSSPESGGSSAGTPTPPTHLTLNNISMTVEKGAMIGIVGAMASGKTTLVSALMGEMNKTKGTFVVTDKIINAPNKPWMKAGTVRDNILFGAGNGPTYGEHPEPDNILMGNRRCKLYEKIIKECGLMEDLQRLPDGDLTWVEPNGENLSGGQKQRISLARVAYLNASIYLLDDPLSAIDPCSKHKVFNQVE